jgi:hypothetical protein
VKPPALQNCRAAGCQNGKPKPFWSGCGHWIRVRWSTNSSLIPLFCCLICPGAVWSNAGAATFTNILAIDFEPSEGYTQGLPLAGQNLWLSNDPTKGCLVEPLWPGLGLQAYVGLTALSPGNDTLLERHPVTYPTAFDPASQQTPCVSFSVLFRIEPSTEGTNDDFSWFFSTPSPYVLLFTLTFDHTDNRVYYETNGSDYRYSLGTQFTNSFLHRLEVDMDFTNNLWSASLNGTSITPGPIPIAPANQRFILGYLYAAWLLSNADDPGNNFMAFDHIRVVAGATPPTLPQPALQLSKANNSAAVSVTVETEPGLVQFLDTSDDLQNWQPFASTYATNFAWTVSDSSAATNRQGFYRGRASAGP